MSVRIPWLLQQRHLDLRLRAGRSGIDNPIQFAQATELLDPRPWLSGGELILTTGLDLRASSAQYVDRLVDAQVSGLAFGTGLSHPDVPAELVSRADEAGLPVLEVPIATPFAAVTKAVMARLAEQQYELVRRAADTQTRITRAALRGGPVAIVRELSVATRGSVAFVGRRTADVHPPTDTALVDEARALVEQQGATPGSMNVSTPGRTLTVQPVNLAGTAHGVLAVSTPRPLEGVERVLLGHAVSLLTLELEKPLRLRDSQNRLGGLAFGLLLDGALPPSQADGYLDDAMDDDGLLRVLEVDTPHADKVRRHLDHTLRDLARPLVARVHGPVASAMLRGSDTRADVETWLSTLPVNQLRTIRAGLSSSHTLDGVEDAALQAKSAVDMASAHAPIAEFGAAEGTTLLSSEPVRRALRAIAASTVAVLDEHDKAEGSFLVSSLRAYLEANGQWESAAASLNVHRHTLRSRIGRVETVLECDLSNALVRAELLLALHGGGS
ncbi:PucR family transcriptional regulator [Actinomycetes bacterium M1A6_2h]